MTEICLNPGSLQEQTKNYFVQGHLAQTSPHGPVIWKVMQKKCVERYCDALMTVKSQKKNWDLLENRQTYALKSS